MSIKEIELAIAQLKPTELSEFATWFEEFWAQVWDKQIEQDIKSGRLDGMIQQVEQEFAAGRCKPL
jgi:hypothetical protein